MTTPTTPPTRPPHGPGAPQRPEPGPEVGSGGSGASAGSTALRDQIFDAIRDARCHHEGADYHPACPDCLADPIEDIFDAALAAKDAEIERLRELLKVEAAVRSAARTRRGRRR